MHTFRKIRIVVALIFIIGGVYVAYLVLFAAGRSQLNVTPSAKQQFMQMRAPQVNEQDTLIIPKINVVALINPGGNATLANGAIWHRQPQNGDPEQGGNFVLAGHRWDIASTPARTRVNSVLYDLDKLQAGDEIIVDYKKHRFTYIVDATKQVKPSATEIENRTTEPRLTLYTCTLAGAADGRVVVTAKLKK